MIYYGKQGIGQGYEMAESFFNLYQTLVNKEIIKIVDGYPLDEYILKKNSLSENSFLNSEGEIDYNSLTEFLEKQYNVLTDNEVKKIIESSLDEIKPIIIDTYVEIGNNKKVESEDLLVWLKEEVKNDSLMELGIDWYKLDENDNRQQFFDEYVKRAYTEDKDFIILLNKHFYCELPDPVREKSR